jgi:hypothetical protein
MDAQRRWCPQRANQRLPIWKNEAWSSSPGPSGGAEQAGERLAGVAGADYRCRHGLLPHLQPAPLDSRKPDQVEPGQRTTDLLHPAAGHELAEVDDEEACGLEKLDHLGLGIGVVAGEEDHTLAA